VWIVSTLDVSEQLGPKIFSGSQDDLQLNRSSSQLTGLAGWAGDCVHVVDDTNFDGTIKQSCHFLNLKERYRDSRFSLIFAFCFILFFA
jgi:hypothetical protein